MELPTLGIDISKDTFDIELALNGKLKHKKLTNGPAGFAALGAWLAKHQVARIHACLEATGTYGEDLALYLVQQGHLVSVVNPARIKAFGQSELLRNKDDRVDAGLIRRFCEKQQPPAWQPPAPELRELQALTRHLENLLVGRQQEENRLQAGLKSKAVLKSLRQLVRYFAGEIKRTEKQIQDHLAAHPALQKQCTLLESIPGIGQVTAAKVLAESGSFDNYRSARELAAQAGLTPRNNRSGKLHFRTKLSKTGNSRLRKALFMPAMVAKRYNPIVRSFCLRLAAHGKNKMQILGAAMRKLIHIAFGVLKSGNTFNPNHESRRPFTA